VRADNNIYAPGDEQEAAEFFSGLNEGSTGDSKKGSVLIDSGDFYAGLDEIKRIDSGRDRVEGGYGVIVSPSGFSSIAEVSRDDMLAVTGGGVKVEDLQRAAGESGMYFPAANIYPGDITMAQLIDEHPVAHTRRAYGGVREYILSIHMVTPAGKRISAGSRSIKDVTGYDLIGFASGSLGRCGLITRVVARLLPDKGYRKIFLYTGQVSVLREASLEINREAGPVCQYIFFDEAAVVFAAGCGIKDVQLGSAEGVLAVRVEAGSVEGVDRVGKKLDTISGEKGMRKLPVYEGDIPLSELVRGGFESTYHYESALHLSFDSSTELNFTPSGFVWSDLYPERVHYLIPFKGSDRVQLSKTERTSEAVIRRMGGIGSFRADLLRPGGTKLPLGVNYLKRALLSGDRTIRADEILEGIRKPFLLRDSLDEIDLAENADIKAAGRAEKEIRRVFDPGSIVIER